MAEVLGVHFYLIQLVCLFSHESKVVDILLDKRIIERSCVLLEPGILEIGVGVDMPCCAQIFMAISTLSFQIQMEMQSIWIEIIIWE